MSGPAGNPVNRLVGDPVNRPIGDPVNRLVGDLVRDPSLAIPHVEPLFLYRVCGKNR